MLLLISRSVSAALDGIVQHFEKSMAKKAGSQNGGEVTYNTNQLEQWIDSLPQVRFCCAPPFVNKNEQG